MNAATNRHLNERLPRYTSYPTAPHFSPSVDTGLYRSWLAGVPADARGSIYVHLPFCRTMCWYCGCNTTVTRRDAPIMDYVKILQDEMTRVAAGMPHRLRVKAVHFGGGTPTMVPAETLIGLAAHLRRTFDIAPGAEWAIEIDPRGLAPETVDALSAIGVNRASLGVQTFSKNVQQAINRVQSFEDTEDAVARLRRAGISGINFDLIYGLPLQTSASCVATALQSIMLRPDRIAVFGYAHVPAFKKHQRKIDEAALPDGLERLVQATVIAETLADAGYVRIGMDHFALPDDPLAAAQRAGRLHRNFQGYTTDGNDVLLGFGASAIGRLPQGYVQNSAVIRDYSIRVADGGLGTARGFALNDDDRLRGEIIERIMCDFGVDLAPICAGYGRSPGEVILSAQALSPLIQDGIVSIDGSRIAIAGDYRHFVRVVAAAFDAYVGSGGRQFSRAV